MLCLALLVSPVEVQEPDATLTYSVDMPDMFIAGEDYVVTVNVQASIEADATIPSWALTPAAFGVRKTALGGRRAKGELPLQAGMSLSMTLNLGQALDSGLRESGAGARDGFTLKYLPAEDQNQAVSVMRTASEGLDFMEMPLAELKGYQVVMLTQHGRMRAELWSDVAPNHARNFLDLAYSGFYDDNQFHRVVPGFMIQGGSAGPGRPAPRTMKNEFNKHRHVPGVLSMARMGMDTKDASGKTIPAFDSATSEFFVMHAVYPSLDGKYTAFGKVLTGLDVVESVVDSVKQGFNPRDPRTHRPRERQQIRRILVIEAPKANTNNSDTEK